MIGRRQPRASSRRKFLGGGAFSPRPERMECRRAALRTRGSRAYLQGRVCHLLPHPQATGANSNGRFYGRDPGKTESGACGTCPVGRRSTCLPRLCPGNGGTGRHLGFAGETPARKWSLALFDRRLGASSLVGEKLCIVLWFSERFFSGTNANGWIFFKKPMETGLAFF